MKNQLVVFVLCLQGWFVVDSFLFESQNPVCWDAIRDPLWTRQWYLKSSSGSYDINVLPAWRKCYNGSGINVAVVDTGIDIRNIDLQNRVQRQGLIPGTVTLESQHGTEVAGLIAADANTAFGRGIAFGATLIDIPLVNARQDTDVPSAAFLHNGADVFSCSFSRLPDGLTVYKMSEETRRALQSGTDNGRNGKGYTYIVSSGNGGGILDDSCAYQEFMNNANVILVAGVDHQLNPIPTSERCSAIMVTAPTRSLGFNVRPELITTMGTNITGNFGMTSAAVAMVSGAVAVMLSANSGLKYRDVMHILARSSRPESPTTPFQHVDSDSQFKCNGAGFLVSQQYGFGLIDVGAMVDTAVQWTNVERKYTHSVQIKNAPIQDFFNENRLSPTNSIMVDFTCPVVYLEHVEVAVTINAQNIGQTEIYLTAPSGFSSKIIPGRFLDRRNQLNITVVSVQFWGMNPKGYWKIGVGKGFDAGEIVDFKITFHGITVALPGGKKCIYTTATDTHRNGFVNGASHNEKRSSTESNGCGFPTVSIAIGVSLLTKFFLS